MSIRLQIRDAVIVALNAAAKPADVPEATKRRWVLGASTNDPAISVIFLEEPSEQPMPYGALTRRALLLGIECTASAALPDLADDVVEPMINWTVSALGDTNLNGLAHVIQEQNTSWETAQADKFYVRATVRFTIVYQTKRNDLTRKQ